MQRLPATVPQLVEASPSATEDGALLLGSHRSSVFVVDAKKGTLLRVLAPHGEGMPDLHHPGTCVAHCIGLSKAAVVFQTLACCAGETHVKQVWLAWVMIKQHVHMVCCCPRALHVSGLGQNQRKTYKTCSTSPMQLLHAQ